MFTFFWTDDRKRSLTYGHKKTWDFVLIEVWGSAITQVIQTSKAHDNHRERLLLYLVNNLFEILRISDLQSISKNAFICLIKCTNSDVIYFLFLCLLSFCWFSTCKDIKFRFNRVNCSIVYAKLLLFCQAELWFICQEEKSWKIILNFATPNKGTEHSFIVMGVQFFETTDDRLTFLITIPIHEDCSESEETRQKSIDKILKLIEENPQITTAKIAMAIGLSNSGVEKNLRTLKEMGIIKRVGSPTYGGRWENYIR